jgi:hypothetical protein
MSFVCFLVSLTLEKCMPSHALLFYSLENQFGFLFFVFAFCVNNSINEKKNPHSIFMNASEIPENPQQNVMAQELKN